MASDNARTARPATFIDALLGEQRELTAVEAFARAHDRGEISEPRYRRLLPAASPARGWQLAFEVDLDQCSGCKACVTACHALNGLDDGEAWREVGELVSEDGRRPFRQTVTTACHHCVEPGCLDGCPVLAYEKDGFTGIVRHLDDQCIGCQYCVMMCPYDVPKYSARRGIVRKCDLCSQRLAASEAPACVQACPNEAIRISVVEQAVVRAEYRETRFAPPGNQQTTVPGSAPNRFLPASPDPRLTLPTTRYVSKRQPPSDAIPSNAAEVRLEPPHWPLTWMLVLTQWGVGGSVVLPLVSSAVQPALAVLALVVTVAGMAASVAHLGRPARAWRAFLGVRTSWLSREIIAFGAFLPLSFLSAFLLFTDNSVGKGMVIQGMAAMAGALAVSCSGMVYHVTRRAAWRGLCSAGRFLATAAVLGLASAWLVESWQNPPASWWAGLLALAMTLKLAGEHRLLRRADEPEADTVWAETGGFDAWALAQGARRMREQLGLQTRLRFACGITGGIVLPLSGGLAAGATDILALASLALCFAGELLERHLFFRAVVPPRMPGGAA